jgi:hypothetical protein
MAHFDDYPVISTRANGDRLIGIAEISAEDLYRAGTPPVHGLAARPAPSVRVARVRIGDRLAIQRQDDHWVAQDATGELGRLRWRASDDGRAHAATGALIALPTEGVLHVQRLVVDVDGRVKDFGGYVEPS